MNNTELAIFISVCSGLVIAAILGAIAWIKKHFKKHNNRQILVSIQVESLLEGLKNVNHNFGVEFSAGYDKKYKELVEKHNFINQG